MTRKLPNCYSKKLIAGIRKSSLHGGVGRAQALVLRPRSKGGTRYFLVLYIQTREFLTGFFMPIQNSKSQRGHKLKSSRTIILKKLIALVRKSSLHGGVGRAQALVLRPRSKGGQDIYHRIATQGSNSGQSGLLHEKWTRFQVSKRRPR